MPICTDEAKKHIGVLKIVVSLKWKQDIYQLTLQICHVKVHLSTRLARTFPVSSKSKTYLSFIQQSTVIPESLTTNYSYHLAKLCLKFGSLPEDISGEEYMAYYGEIQSSCSGSSHAHVTSCGNISATSCKNCGNLPAVLLHWCRNNTATRHASTLRPSQLLDRLDRTTLTCGFPQESYVREDSLKYGKTGKH